MSTRRSCPSVRAPASRAAGWFAADQSSPNFASTSSASRVTASSAPSPFADIATAIGAVDSGRGVIVLTDLFGGTPSNLAISLMERGRVEVIAGMNLPMLIRLGSARKSMKVVEAVAAAREAGRKYISVASEVLGEAAA